MALATIQRAAATRVVRPTAVAKPCVVRPGALPLRRQRASIAVQAAPKADASGVTKQELYKNDQLTHSIVGEYDMAIFFLAAGLLTMLPVVFPGFILIAQWFNDTFPHVFEAFL